MTLEPHDDAGHMVIGEFGSPAAAGSHGTLIGTSPLYCLHEMAYAAARPTHDFADMMKFVWGNPASPLASTPPARALAACAEVIERATRRYGKPHFGLNETIVDGEAVSISEEVVWKRPFCQLLHFRKDLPASATQPRLLIVAPMSGHYATLLRGTVAGMLPEHDVYITDWADARMVPLADGPFDLDDYIDYIIEILHHLGGDTHVMAVCQPSVPVLAAVALMEAAKDEFSPRSMILMGGPIDTRVNPTAVNRLAEEKGIEWFRRNVIAPVPFPNPGMLRLVYPGFLQLSGFVSMNLDRHVNAHREFFSHLVTGESGSAERHREFYDEYFAVMDLTAEFYLQTVDAGFIRHLLPKGEMTHRGTPVLPEAIRNVGLMTVEGERDDISGVGQTEAAHRLCTSIPADRKLHWLQPRVGHYGVFSGSRFVAEIVPQIAGFIRRNERSAQPSLRVVASD